MTGQPRNRVLLIGWDAADWKVLNPLLDSGKMPNLKGIVERGIIGDLATLTPDLSPLLWTSIATGKRPYKHGILGFTEPDPHTGGIRPITNLSRRTKAIWNVLSQEGLKCSVVGWWPSHPVEPINGVMVSNHYQTPTGSLDKPWPIRPGTVHPARIEKHLAPLRWHPEKLEAGHILRFVPRAAEIDQDKDRRLSSVAKIICDTCSIGDAGVAILHNKPWDFAALYFDGIDHFCHGFMSYHPPRPDWVPQEDFERYSEVVSNGYILHDFILGRLLEQAGDNATVLVVSDHGFRSDHLRRPSVPLEPAGPAVQHRHHGVFAMAGPGIKQDDRLYGACLLDIAPTVLALFGLPNGQDIDGRVLIDAFTRPPPLPTIPSWDDVQGPSGMHPPDKRIDPVLAHEAIEQLVALGYIERPDEHGRKAVDQAVREQDYNLARSYMDAGRHADAAVLLEKLWEQWPDEHRFGMHLVRCYEVLQRIPQARKHLEEVFRRKQRAIESSREKLGAWATEHGDKEPVNLSDKERRELRELRAKASWNSYVREYLLGTLRLYEGDEAGALEHLKNAQKLDFTQPDLFLKLGDVYLSLRQWKEAEGCFDQALELDPDHFEAWLGIGHSMLARRHNAAAADAATASIRLKFHNPQAFNLLGTAFHRMNELEEAIRALNMAVGQNSNFPQAHRRLAYIYKNRLDDHLKAAKHQRLARQAAGRLRDLRKGRSGFDRDKESADELKLGDHSIRGHPDPVRTETVGTLVEEKARSIGDEVIVVSGLPRSGTSMMMQMLAAGGVSLLTDGMRVADEDNPRGYFEFEPARRLSKDPSWLPKAKGKAVKIVAQLLPNLPQDYEYRVLFMERDMHEVLRSQKKMLERTAQPGAGLSENDLARVFSAQVNAVRRALQRRAIPILNVSYGQAVPAPVEVAARVNRFLRGELDENAMASAPELGLYRQRGC